MWHRTQFAVEHMTLVRVYGAYEIREILTAAT